MILTILYWIVTFTLFFNCAVLFIAGVSEKFRNKCNVKNPMLSFWFQLATLYFLTH